MSRPSPRINILRLLQRNTILLHPHSHSLPVPRKYPHQTTLLYSSQSVKMADRVHRVTMFKLPNPANQQKLIQAYKTVDATNQKDGKPYILSLAVGPAEEDPRSQGYTVVCKTEFASMEDLKYYDESCAAHQTLKATAKDLGVEGILTVYFKPQVAGSRA